MMASVNVGTSLASAMAAATLASQQAAQYAAATDTATAGFAFKPIPSQHWDLLRVAELFSTGFPAGQGPPLFQPALGPALPKAPPPVLVGNAPGGVAGAPSSAAPSSKCLAGPSASCRAVAAFAAPAAAAHAEPQTPDLSPAILRSPSLPEALGGSTGSHPLDPPPPVLARPIAIRPVPHARAARTPAQPTGPPPPVHPCEPPPSIPSPGAAFSLVARAQPAPQAPPPQVQVALQLSAAVPLQGKPPVRLVVKPTPPPAGSPKSAGGRKRRGTGTGSPVKRRAASPESMTEGCGDSAEIRGESMERATGYKGRFCGRLFLKEDEKRLAEECEALGPLVGFPAPGKRGHCTVAKLARSIVAGSVRTICEQRDAEVKALQRQLAEQRSGEEARVQQMAREVAAMRQELAVYKSILGSALGPRT